MTTVQYRVVGMDCADDAKEIEEAAQAVKNVATARVSVASQMLTLGLRSDEAISEVKDAVARRGYRLEEVGGPSRVTVSYRRALWTVVFLNVGYGVVEIAGGIIADSQALKADALDFLGDGLITLLGVVAIGWSLAWRARSALLQGVFLGVLGVGVLVNTAYRVIVQRQPEAELMGALGVVALLVNVAAAAVLIPHRTGDANARAVWLFSRNDAIGNAAVIVAALLVAWTQSPWPDLVVAAIVGSLFLHSAWVIVRDARSDLSESARSGAKG